MTERQSLFHLSMHLPIVNFDFHAECVSLFLSVKSLNQFSVLATTIPYKRALIVSSKDILIHRILPRK